jgi:hypothetical protein
MLSFSSFGTRGPYFRGSTSQSSKQASAKAKKAAKAWMRWLQRGFLTCEQHWPFAQTPSPRLPLPQLGRKRPAVELRKPRTPPVVVVLEAAIVDSSLSADNDWEGSSTTAAHDGPTTTTRAANKLRHTFLAKNMVEVFLYFVFPVPDETNPVVGKDCEPKRPCTCRRKFRNPNQRGSCASWELVATWLRTRRILGKIAQAS